MKTKNKCPKCGKNPTNEYRGEGITMTCCYTCGISSNSYDWDKGIIHMKKAGKFWEPIIPPLYYP